MIKLYHAPLTRSTRVIWLLEELGVPYQLETVDFQPPKVAFEQKTPFGKVPAIEDGDVVMFESGAIVEYLLERYGEGRLAPAVGSPLRGAFLQWLHFAEATAFPPIAQLAWHERFAQDAGEHPEIIAKHREWAGISMQVLEDALEGRDYVLGDAFSAADIMLGVTLLSAKYFGVLDERFPRCDAYLTRLLERPGWRTALSS